jgi:futalosine hydrolase
MALKVLLVFATETERDVLNNITGVQKAGNKFMFRDIEISVLITLVGGISTAWALKQWLSANPIPDLAINAGIAGSFSEKFGVGDVVIPVSDCFGDMGIETDGRFVTLTEAGLIDADRHPFEGGMIMARNRFVSLALKKLPGAKAVTVNTASGTVRSIDRLIKKFNPEIETMEGATFFYICAVEKIPFLAVRAVSNRVEPGSRSSWDIPCALDNLAKKLNEILLMLD